MSDSLFEMIAVHCFYSCGHVVRELEPAVAHARMELHYRQDHQPPLRPCPRCERTRYRYLVFHDKTPVGCEKCLGAAANPPRRKP